MSDVLGLFDRNFNPLIAGLIAAAGFIIGGAIYISFSGALLGLLLALALCGLLALIDTVIGGGTGADHQPAPAVQGTASATVAAVQTTAGQAVSGQIKGAAKVIESTLPAGAPIQAVKIEVTETEAQLLNSGRFGDYHLVKAKRLFEAKDFKEAAVQAAASLAHNGPAEAAELRQAARNAMK